MTLSALQTDLGYVFEQPLLLELALTHRSFSAKNNERLEFLGDSVLGCSMSSLLFHRFQMLDEGDLSRVRASLVKQASLADIAQRLKLSDLLRLGEGELKSGGFRRPSILADALEAIFGAVYLDGGFAAAKNVIERLYGPMLEGIDPRTVGKDPKTLLQEYLQGHRLDLPAYRVIDTRGAAHDQEFEVACEVPALSLKVVAVGTSRRAAEQAAAHSILQSLRKDRPLQGTRHARSRSAKSASTALQALPEEGN
ncbi:ribonuclease III [Orrella marina]|uniref:Ribonuclease 3 n=1 Tax=Orrella marina TaxID=2163011 RepID=A0A2R4XJ61_9BURK|nr:ribonuclease III [Orrella marina]AWB33783.1 ribonuclease III [Orrella marina]